MTYPYARLAAKWIGAPLMLDPSKALAIAEAFGPRVFGGDVTVPDARHVPVRPLAGTLTDRLRTMTDEVGRPIYRGPARIGTTALIEIEGTLVDKGAWQGEHSGMMSYEAIGLQVADAMTDTGIDSVVFEVDSPGGMVAGAFDLADRIAALASTKPCMAILTENAMSAGYLMAAACGRIVMPETGAAGSIGTMLMLTQAIRRADAEGFDITVLASGTKKADGHPLAAWSEGFIAETQTTLDTLSAMFADRVARYRPQGPDASGLLALQAAVFTGGDAVSAGLADAVVSPKQALAAFRDRFAAA